MANHIYTAQSDFYDVTTMARFKKGQGVPEPVAKRHKSRVQKGTVKAEAK